MTDRKIRNLGSSKAQRIVGTAKRERSKKSSKRHDVRPREITKALGTHQRGSQALFRTYLEQANDLIFATDISGKMTFVNPETSQVTGYTANELLGRSPVELVVPEARDVAARAAERVSLGERVERIEVEMLSKDARRIFLEVRGRPLGVGGRVVGSLYIARDVTARKQAERKLVESEQKFRSLVEGTSAAVAVADLTGRFTYVNKALADLLGYSVQELAGQPFADFLHPEDRHKVMEVFIQAISSSREAPNIEFRAVRKDASIRNLWSRPTRLTIDGKTVGFEAIITDITERERMERELGQSEERYRLIAENMPGSVWLMDMNLKPTYISPNTTRVRGYTLEELGALPLDRQLTPDSLKLALETFQEALSEENLKNMDPLSRTLQLEFYRRDGSTFWSENTFSLVRNSKGEPAGILGVGREITERKRMEGELQKHSEHLEELVFERTKKLAESERKFRSVVENIPDFVWTSDREANTIFVSPNVERILGYTPEEIYEGGHRLWSQRIHPDDIERLKKAYQSLFSGNEAFDVEYRFQRKNGEWLWLHDRATGTYVRHGMLYADGVTSDITERKRLEEELRAARERLEYVVASNPAVIYSGKPLGDYSDWHLTYISERVASMLGFEPRELIGHPEFWERHVPAEDVRSVLAEMPRLWKEGQHTFEYRFLHKDGTYRWIREEARVVRDTHGKPVEVIGDWTDVTEERRLQEALLRSERLAAIGEMATMMAHDLRNPLTGISGAAYHLRKRLGGTADEKLQEMLELIEKDVEHANRIMSDLLEYSRELHLDLGGTTPRSITEQALVLVEIPSAVRVSNLTNDQPEVRMDAEKMKRVFVNLIRNAVDAMPQGGELTIQSKESNGNLQVSFSDTGAGITEEVASRMWTPFFTTKAKGIGLGLSISKRIVEAHKGHISYETKVGKGSSFVVAIPLQARNHD